MARLVRALFYLVILVALAVVGFAIFSDLPAPVGEVVIPVSPAPPAPASSPPASTAPDPAGPATAAPASP
jgi:hypothetical protein